MWFQFYCSSNNKGYSFSRGEVQHGAFPVSMTSSYEKDCLGVNAKYDVTYAKFENKTLTWYTISQHTTVEYPEDNYNANGVTYYWFCLA